MKLLMMGLTVLQGLTIALVISSCGNEAASPCEEVCKKEQKNAVGAKVIEEGVVCTCEGGGMEFVPYPLEGEGEPTEDTYEYPTN